MFHRISNSWRLFTESLSVLSKDKELLIFPILSGLAALALLASFAAGMFGTGLAQELLQHDPDVPMDRQTQAIGIAVAFVYYFFNFFVMTYFTAALVGAAHIRLSGGDPTVGDGFAAANRCLGALLGYSLIAATVGLILRAAQDNARNNIVGRIVIGLIGMAWTLITYLVVPVLVIERLGPIGSLKRSAGLLRQTWGEQIIANFGFGFVGFVFSLLGIALLALAAFAFVSVEGAPWLGLSIGAAALLYFLVLSIVLSALRGIYTAALYTHAAGRTPHGFPVDLVAQAFSPKHR